MADAIDTTDNELDPEEEEQDDDETPEGDEDGQGKTGDEDKDKKSEAPEAKKARLERQLDRHRKAHPDLYKDTEDKPKKAAPKAASKDSDLDLGQKAYLIASGFKDADEMQLARDIMRETHRSLEDTLNSKYFQSEVKSLREERAAAEAIPDKSRRNATQGRSSVEFWIAKGELPPNTPENRELRAQVVNARLKQEKNSSQFSSNPVVGRG